MKILISFQLFNLYLLLNKNISNMHFLIYVNYLYNKMFALSYAGRILGILIHNVYRQILNNSNLSLNIFKLHIQVLKFNLMSMLIYKKFIKNCQ